jgi:ADP-heptose:LPS heptosyltransferase
MVTRNFPGKGITAARWTPIRRGALAAGVSRTRGRGAPGTPADPAQRRAAVAVTYANILVIAFGQLGDVVLCLPALNAVRHHFAHAKLTVAVGKSCAAVIELASGLDDMIVVDRVELRDGPRLQSMREIVRLVRDVRARRFDLVIDLHSLSETNLLGFLSGARHRLYAHRERRSLDWLSTFVPPREDKQQHLTERYLSVLRPLGISRASHTPVIAPRRADLASVDALWMAHDLRRDEVLVGIFPGAGHESRRWSLGNFAALAERMTRDERVRVAVFLGPEEGHLMADVRAQFSGETRIINGLSLHQLVAALSRLSVFVTNDTGPMHLAAAVGTPVVVVLDQAAPTQYLPLVRQIRAVRSGPLRTIGVSEVHDAAMALLTAAGTPTDTPE